MGNKSKLLFDSNPLIIIPELAVLIGLNESIILQQIHYWLQKSTHLYDGRAWVYNSIPQWCEQFPFLSQRSIERALASLKNLELILTANYNKLKQDRTLWYTIDYDALESLQEKRSNSHENPPRQNGGMVPPQGEEPSNPHENPSRQNGGMVLTNCRYDHDNLGRPLPEITTEITTEKENQSVRQLVIPPDKPEAKETDEPTNELQTLFDQAQVDMFQSNALKENLKEAITAAYSKPETKTLIQRIKLDHIDIALAKYREASEERSIKNPRQYFFKCLVSAVAEYGLKEFALLE